ncbi:MAG: hypothetical protein EPN93_19510 [Spirochaetes bacterium]|nr:MAG: hypothetical protein EPN93_19510 [Spirochaetota bacterium]
MKSASQARISRREVEINLLAHKAVSNNYSRKRVLREIDMLFADSGNAIRERILLKVMRRCYETVYEPVKHVTTGGSARTILLEKEYISEEKFYECFAVKLCSFLIEKFQGSAISCTRDYRFSKDFYTFCIRELTEKEIVPEHADAEILEINLKQALIMLRQSGVLVSERGKARITDRIFSGTSLFMLVFSSFWNSVRWEDIFPSNESAARDLKKDRYILIDIMLKHHGSFTVDDASNAFFDLTGFSRINDLHMISFLDFYFFTWMKYFGLLLYEETGGQDSVKVCLTEQGRKFLSGLQNPH